MAEDAPGRTVSSIFFGGGTPSLMEPETVDGNSRRDRAAPGRSRLTAEITLEANPTSVEAERFNELPGGRRQPRLARRPGHRTMPT